MIYEEKTISSETVFNGKIIKLKVETVTMPNGKTAYREFVRHPGGVGIVAINEKDEIVLVKQYRKPLDKVIYEIPAGKLDGGEEHRICGLRELKEETGYIPEVFEYMGYIYPSPGFVDEVTHVYYAENLKCGDTAPDEDEFLDVETIPFDKAYEMVLNGEINDAKSVFGIMKYAALRKAEKR